MAKNPVLDFEERLKLLVANPMIAYRTNICNDCPSASINKICLENFQLIPDYVQYKYAECPKKKWSHGWDQK